jgi:tetratricopeptide (TPR) repeat protein
MKQLSAICVLAVLVPAINGEQRQNGVALTNRCGVYGRVLAPSELLPNITKIELTGEKARQKAGVVNGTFEVKTVPPGSYQFRFLDDRGDVLLKRVIQVSGTGTNVVLRLPLSDAEQAIQHVVSFQALGRQPDKTALKTFQKGQQALELGDNLKSIEYFEKAAALDPKFAQAEQNLAVQLAFAGHEAEAVAHAETAYNLESNVGNGETLAILLLQTQKYSNADSLLRNLLKTAGRSPELSGWLALALIGESRLREALEYLNSLGDEWPYMHVLAARALAQTGHAAQAVSQIEEFMHAATDCERQEMEQWSKQISDATFSQFAAAR